MKRILLCMVLFLAFIPAPVFSASEKGNTPYGDYSPDCCRYGVCKKLLSEQESRHAIEQYYGDKIRVDILKRKGRFIEADIIKKGVLQDRILFDRMTGRIRSIY